MSEEHPQPVMSTRWLMIPASGLSVVTGPDLARDVAIHLHIPENQFRSRSRGWSSTPNDTL